MHLLGLCCFSHPLVALAPFPHSFLVTPLFDYYEMQEHRTEIKIMSISVFISVQHVLH